MKPKTKLPDKNIYLVNEGGKLYQASFYSASGDNIIIEYRGDFHEFHRSQLVKLEPYGGIIKFENLNPPQL